MPLPVNHSSLISKKAVRVLGIAESFDLGRPRSVLVGTVMRSDWVMDGAVVSYASVGGLDATRAIMDIYSSLERSDVHLVMIDGCILSWYNVVDLDKLRDSLGVPVMCISFEDAKGDAAGAIRKLFPDADERLALLEKLGRPAMIATPHGVVWVRSRGIDYRAAKTVIKRFQREGKRPEPIRISKLISSAVLRSLIEGQGDGIDPRRP